MARERIADLLGLGILKGLGHTPASGHAASFWSTEATGRPLARFPAIRPPWRVGPGRHPERIAGLLSHPSHGRAGASEVVYASDVARTRTRRPVLDPRVTWISGEHQDGPNELIGVLEVRADGSCRAALAERVKVDGRCHIRLARTAWQSKDALETRWWSLVLDREGKAFTVRNGSCGDALLAADVPRIVRALESLRFSSSRTMIAVDDGPAVFPWMASQKRS